MPVTVHHGMKWVASGDSISAPDRRVLEPLPPLVAATTTGTGAPATVTGTVNNGILQGGGTSAIIQPGVQLNMVWTGVPGQQSAAWKDGVDQQVSAWNPDIISILMGINDATVGTLGVPTPQATYQANMEAGVARIRAVTAAPIILLSVMCFDERWSPGPVWLSHPTNTLIDQYNTSLQTVAGAHANVIYVDGRASLLIQESIVNIGNAASGIFTTDGIHPAMTPTAPGRQTMRDIAAAAVFAQLTVS